MRKQVIKTDKVTAYINNHDWVIPVVFWGGIILAGIIEAL